MMQRCYKPDAVVAEITRSTDAVEMRLTDVPTAEKLEKFVEDVRWAKEMVIVIPIHRKIN